MSALPDQSVPYGGELAGGPPAPLVARPRMQRDEGYAVLWNRVSGLGQVLLRNRETRLQVCRASTDKARHLQVPEVLRLVVDVGYGAVEGRGVGCPGARRDPRPEPSDEGVGVAAAAVHLERQVEALLPHLRKEALQLLLVLIHACVGAVDAGGGGDGDRVRDRLATAREEPRLEGAAQERDLRLRVSLLERPKRRQREDGVAEPAGPQDGDLVYVLYPFRAGGRRHGG